jgi:hypothetical protein
MFGHGGWQELNQQNAQGTIFWVKVVTLSDYNVRHEHI